jgi:RsiW-degrading membrane proteinase PrsW (M82 family)
MSDPSIDDEPHMRGEPLRGDPSERTAETKLNPERHAPESGAAKLEHSVWDEPGLSRELAGEPPPGTLTYETWLARGRGRTGWPASWAVTAVVALLAGPWAVLGALWGSGQSLFQILLIIVFGPVAEEVMKTAAVLYVIEKRPYWYRSPLQIALCALAGGLAFAAIENLMYLHVHIADPSPGLVYWRWTVCTGMHTACSFIAGLGLVRIWRDVWKRRARPNLTLGFPYLAAAILIHGSYNAFAMYLAMSDYQF